MKLQLLLITSLVAIATVQAGSQGAAVDAPAAFAKLKTLAGEWEADTAMGKVHVSYEVVGAGTALLERESSEKMPAMVTLYHLDGSRLILTHYCMTGNQPRMLARNFNAETGEIQFQFLDATNLASPATGHMHNARLRLVDSDHFNAEWQFYEDGKPKMTETAQYSRVR